MKKKYINPKAEIIQIASAPLLDIASAQLDEGQNITNSDDFGSRGDNDDWDD